MTLQVQSRARTLDWTFIGHATLLAVYVLVAGAFAVSTVRLFLEAQPSNLFLDAHIYFRATSAWLSGSNPWETVYNGFPFAAPPPALLLNLALQPLGEDLAVATWAVASIASTLFIFRRLRLPLWMWLFHPLVEGFLAGSPDLVLAGLVLAGGGAVSAAAKPYAVPAMLAARRWRAVVIGAGIVLVTVPVLPWGVFIASRGLVSNAFEEFTVVVSAFGSPALMVATGVALASLGRARALQLFTPGLLAQQPHYLVFSLEAISKSLLLAIFMTIPLDHYAALGIVVYAIAETVQRQRARSRGNSRGALDRR